MKKFFLVMAAVCSMNAYGKAPTEPKVKPSHGPVAGGYASVAVTDTAVLAAAEFAVAEINAQSESVEPLTLLEVVSAKSQVVAGVNYTLVLSLSRGDDVEVHQVVVFTQAWTHTTLLTSDTVLAE